MNRETQSEEQRQLHEVLAAWQVGTPPPPRFAERVWQRIGRLETQPSDNPWALLISWVEQALARPSLAVSYVTVLLAAGLLAGFWQAQVTKARAAETLSTRYVQMVDPYQTPRTDR